MINFQAVKVLELFYKRVKLEVRTHLFIDWDELGLSWAPTEVIELDIQTVRDNRLKELGI